MSRNRCHACDRVGDDIPDFPKLPMCAQCAKAWRMGERIGREMGEQEGAAVAFGLMGWAEAIRANATRILPKESTCSACRAGGRGFNCGRVHNP